MRRSELAQGRDDSDLWAAHRKLKAAVARHEAGHVVVGYVLGGSVGSTMIHQLGDGGESEISLPFDVEDGLTWCRSRLAISVAGRLADKGVSGYSNDVEKEQGILAKLEPHGHIPKYELKWAMANARRILHARRAMVTRIAEALLASEAGRLTGVEVHSLLSGKARSS